MAHLSPLPQRHHYTHLHGLLALLDGLKLSNLLFKRLNLFLAFFFRTWIFHARKATHPPVAVVTIVASARVLARPARALFVVFFGPGVWAVLITVKPNTPKVHIEKNDRDTKPEREDDKWEGKCLLIHLFPPVSAFTVREPRIYDERFVGVVIQALFLSKVSVGLGCLRRVARGVSHQ